MPGTHSLLSPSGSHRWLHCTPSARMTEGFAESTNDAADEGTLAHSLAELILKRKIKKIDQTTYKKELAEIEAHKHFKKVMFDYCEDFSVFVLEKYAEVQQHTPDAKLLLEQRVDLTKYIPEPGNGGTADIQIIGTGILILIDYKYGKGVEVEIQENPQLKLYALGALEQHDDECYITDVEMYIYQPRLDNIGGFKMKANDLYAWGVNTVIPQADKAWNGTGTFIAGDHCRFCQISAACKANAVLRLGVTGYDEKLPELLTPAELADIFKRSKALIDWVKKVKDFMLQQALDNDITWPDLKLVRSRANRSFADEDELIAYLTSEDGGNFDTEALYNKSLLGIGDMEELLGKEAFQTLEKEGYVIKPKGKPTLTLLSDKAPALDKRAEAKEDFDDLPTNIFD